MNIVDLIIAQLFSALWSPVDSGATLRSWRVGRLFTIGGERGELEKGGAGAKESAKKDSGRKKKVRKQRKAN